MQSFFGIILYWDHFLLRHDNGTTCTIDIIFIACLIHQSWCNDIRFQCWNPGNKSRAFARELRRVRCLLHWWNKNCEWKKPWDKNRPIIPMSRWRGKINKSTVDYQQHPNSLCLTRLIKQRGIGRCSPCFSSQADLHFCNHLVSTMSTCISIGYLSSKLLHKLHTHRATTLQSAGLQISIVLVYSFI